MSFRLPFTSLAPIEVFAVEDTVAQLTWRDLGRGDVAVTIEHPSGGETKIVGDAHGPGAEDIGGLLPGHETPVTVAVGGRRVARLTVRTLPSLFAEPLARIATVSDLLFGEDGGGVLPRLRDRADGEPYPLRCARAAVREAQDWGADVIVIKGDITELGRPHEWEMLDALLSEIHVPVLAVPGNHDTTGARTSLDATTELQRRGLFPGPVHTHDVDGARIVMLDSTVHGRSFGRIGRHTDELLGAIDTPLPAVVFTHHHLEALHAPSFWPLGVQRFDTAELLRQMFRTNADLVISSGHSHRNRVRGHASGLITEVSATKDFPGVWAGYAVHADGVRQVVRRVSEPSSLRWNDRTHATVGGVWGQWSPGRLHDRCVSHRWTHDRSVAAPNSVEHTDA